MSVHAAGHLGGYIEGGDPATFYPHLWDWLVNDLGVRSVIDVGCGDGVAVDYFDRLGCVVLGIDGVPQDHELIVTHDFTTGPMVDQPNRADLVWSCEFVEHVEEQHALNFLATFEVADMVMMTHAFPGQPGYHHVNCREADYWVALLASVGLWHDPVLTEEARRRSMMNTNPWNHFVRSGLAFTKEA